MGINITPLLDIADNNAFSNLYDIVIGNEEPTISKFKLRVETIQIDGYNMEYGQSEAIKQFFIKKGNKINSLSLSVRESSDFYFLKYLNDWFTSMFDPITNTYKVGSNPPKKRNIKITTYGNSMDTPALTISTNSAMIEKCPSLTLGWSDSKPIVYQVSFKCNSVSFEYTK